MDLRQFIDRYGAPLGVMAAFALLVVLLPGNASGDRVDTGDDFDLSVGDVPATTVGDVDLDPGGEVDPGAGNTGTTAPAGTGGASQGGGGAPAEAEGGGDEAAAEAAEVVFGEGPHCRDDGRQIGITRYMPPCVTWNGTDNGGATFRGVTPDQVVVVRWLGQIDPGTSAILQHADLADSRNKVNEIYDALRIYSNQHYETYGREVVFVDYDASGESENDEAMNRDAINIAEMQPFAVIEGDPAAPLPVNLARGLAQRNILCMCTTSLSSAFYTELPPMIWSSLPTIDDYAEHAAEYVSKRLAGRPAEHAGDDQNPLQSFNDTERVFGLIYLEGERGRPEPERDRARRIFEQRFNDAGIEFRTKIGYLYDPGRNQQDVTAMIARMRNDGVTTIVPLWDPLYPILITTEASNQLYFPEWLVVGTGLSDTTTAGRLYDQRQWRSAFGISPLWVTWETVARSTGAREYHHGRPGRPPGDEGVLVNIYRARIQTLFRGIHMAGPDLTNETWVRGTIAYPPTGGTPASPLVFATRERPTEIKDFVEVFYAANESGPDERGQQGTGMMMKVDGGTRYRQGEWPTGPPNVFNMSGAIAVSDNPPGGGDPPHEQDGHRHDTRCLSCPA